MLVILLYLHTVLKYVNKKNQLKSSEQQLLYLTTVDDMLGNIKKSEIGSGFNKINANSLYMHTQIGVRFVLDDFLDLTL